MIVEVSEEMKMETRGSSSLVGNPTNNDTIQYTTITRTALFPELLEALVHPLDKLFRALGGEVLAVIYFRQEHGSLLVELPVVCFEGRDPGLVLLGRRGFDLLDDFVHLLGEHVGL